MSDWRHHALCRDEDPELFFPIGTSGPALLQVEQAKAVCQRCSVTSECLQWALDSGQDAGVWGGMSEDERRLMKRRGGLRVRERVVDGALDLVLGDREHAAGRDVRFRGGGQVVRPAGEADDDAAETVRGDGD